MEKRTLQETDLSVVADSLYVWQREAALTEPCHRYRLWNVQTVFPNERLIGSLVITDKEC